MQDEFLFSGFGGQGVMFVGQLLAYAAMDEGFNVTWIPSYGPEMRGGTAHCFVILSSKQIGSPIVRHPKAAVVFNNPSFDKYETIVAPGGLLVVNETMIERRSGRADITTVYVPGTGIADALGNLRLTNMVLLGATLAARPLLRLDGVKHALEHHLPSHRRNLLEANFRALDRGAEAVRAALGV